MLRKIIIAIGIIAALVALLPVFVIFMYWFGVTLGPEKKTPWVASPDGKWAAQVRTRSNPDIDRRRLFLRYQNQPEKEIYLVTASDAGLKWSPNSRRVAGMGELNSDAHIWVYDVTSNHFQYDHSYSGADVKHRFKPEQYPTFEWKWRNPDVIDVYAEDTQSTDKSGNPLRYHIAVCEVKDDKSGLKIQCKEVK